MTCSHEPPSGGVRSRCSCGAWWRLPLLLALLLVAMALARGLREPGLTPVPADPSPAAPGKSATHGGDDPARAAPTGPAVSLEIDFGDGTVRRYDRIDWHQGMTVAGAMAAAGRLPGGISAFQQGSGSTALLAEIDGVASEGVAGRNWTFFVNDRLADRGFGVYTVEPGDRILWKLVDSQ